METSLQGAQLTTDELSQSLQAKQEVEEEEHHIHLPKPSLWPFILSAAIVVTVAGLFFVPDTPWLTVVGAPFILIGILGWGLEDPMGEAHISKPLPIVSEKDLVEQAYTVVDRIVTFGSTAYSTHPIKVESEGEGILTVYGKVELEAQRQELDDALWEIPGVRMVHNYVVAEDGILNLANARIDALRVKGKLEGAKDLSFLVENYILSLYGEVPTTDMKYALEKEMLGIPGVRVVVNHIGLNKEIPGNLGHTLNKIGGV